MMVGGAAVACPRSARANPNYTSNKEAGEQRDATEERTQGQDAAARRCAGSRALASAPAPFSGVLPQALRGLDAGVLSRRNRDLDLVIKELHSGQRGAKTPLGAGEEDSAKPRKRPARR